MSEDSKKLVKSERKIAVAFSGGALRAAAHIGVIRFLEEKGVHIGAVSGSSAGAMIALFVAAGLSSDEMESFLFSIKKRDLFSLSRGTGFFSLKNIESMLRERLGVLDYEELDIPCFSCVTELNSAHTVYLDRGDPISNVIASSSLTPIFDPYEIDEVWYADGGFSDNLPVRPLLQYDMKTLAVNVNPLKDGVPDSFRSLTMRSILLMLHSNILPSVSLCDFFLEVVDVSDMNIFDFRSLEKAVEAGYDEMRSFWKNI